MSHSQTVLLVDDDPLALAALQRSLHAEPYTLLVARTAAGALWVLAAQPVDVLVTDQRMPGMSGAEFLTRVRAEYPHVVSIMLTGHADLRTAIRAINAGEVYRFFTKPCDVGSLAVAIRQALQMQALVRQTRRLLDTTRRQAAELATPSSGGPADADDVRVFEVAPAPTDLGALLREIELELETAERRRVGRGSPP